MNVKLKAEQKKKSMDFEGIAAIMQSVLMRENKIGRAQEHFWIVGLNNANKILFVELLTLGAHNRAIINPPETFRMAIYKLAVKAVLVHNHPSGKLQPSESDIALTDHLTKAGDFLKVKILDHIIISEEGHFSFMATGIMDKINKSRTWRIVKADTEEMEKMKLEMEAKRAEKESAQRIAKKMKKEGLAPEMIKKMTGLTIAAIHKL